MEKIKISTSLSAKFLPFMLVLLFTEVGLAIPVEEIRKLQAGLQGKTTGEKIAFFAERFVGTPYDEDLR